MIDYTKPFCFVGEGENTGEEINYFGIFVKQGNKTSEFRIFRFTDTKKLVAIDTTDMGKEIGIIKELNRLVKIIQAACKLGKRARLDVFIDDDPDLDDEEIEETNKNLTDIIKSICLLYLAEDNKYNKLYKKYTGETITY